MNPLAGQKTINENLETPLEDAGDVVVVGAGSAGVAAAILAAREGARTTLVDPAGFPGGTLVSGLPILGACDGEKQVVKGILQEIVDRLRERDGIDRDPAVDLNLTIDPEKLKIILQEMLQDAGVRCRYHSFFSRAQVENGLITAAVIEGKGGRCALSAKMFIDATGDADLAYSAGVPVEKGRKKDGKVQPMTLMFGVGNIDRERFEKAGGYPYIHECFDRVTRERQFRNPRKKEFSGYWGVKSRAGELAFNVTRVLESDGSEEKSLSAAETEGRLQAWEFLDEFLKPYVAGFEKSYIAWTAAKIGVRETRRIVGEYVLTGEDILAFKKFPDAINCGAYPIDIHSPTDAATELPADLFYGGKYWTIPYRSLVPLKVDNVLVAGRCLSATHEGLAAVRVMANTLGMGEAAGLAAALCVENQTIPRRLDHRLVQKKLLEHGAWLGEISL